MEVTTMGEATAPDPERAVALAARNDYYSGNIIDDDFEEVISGVDGEGLDEQMQTLLVDRLLRQEHLGPFEHPSIMLHVKGMSRVTMAQITRHRHMSFDIQSMRYVNFDEADVAVPKSLTDPDHFSRETGEIKVTPEQQREFEAVYEAHVDNSISLYNGMVNAGIPKEDARYVLPLGTTVNVVMSGNLRTMMHVMNMRMKGNAQWEIRDLSNQVVEQLHEWAPITAAYFEEHGPFKLGM